MRKVALVIVSLSPEKTLTLPPGGDQGSERMTKARKALRRDAPTRYKSPAPLMLEELMTGIYNEFNPEAWPRIGHASLLRPAKRTMG